ncbi:MAG: two-component system, OmpR family, sensor histidine kinase KdpD [Acidobacteriota bacterium]|nr:two-component system, OmpR family, sensor histidine kinase KdpD [Acidobacteriota bacterium]
MSEEKANSFLKMIRRSQRGRLKIYLGYCAGVGKTYRMLQEGQVMRSEGIDVVVGLAETHGRRDIVKLLEGFEIIPRLVREYKGINIEEMDVDAILARRPAVALIDELAHNNVPGSRNLKRYQDVQEILDAGIHVITTLNVQHLESLYDTVEKFVGVKVRERLPDTVISEADQIVNIDLSTEDLRKRLEEGKIYPGERIQTALNNFFISSNLEKLRELTLRELAAQIDFRRKEPLPEDTAAMPDQVMVCLSSRGPNSNLLLRYASRFAGRLNKNWYALYVQREEEDPTHIDLKSQDALANTLTLARQLGAIVFTYKGEDLADTILRFAREYRIGHIIIGTPTRRPFFKRLFFKKTLSERLVEEAGDINIVIVGSTHHEVVPEEPRPGDTVKTAVKPVCLGDFLSEKTIITWKDTVLKEEVMRDLTRAAYDEGQGFEEIYNALMQREKESSTFFNEGVAFPHLRLAGDFSPRVSLGIIPGGIANISTANPIRLVFLVISSIDQVEIQGKILAAASKIARSNHLVDVLLSAKNSRRVLAEINKWESAYL